MTTTADLAAAVQRDHLEQARNALVREHAPTIAKVEDAAQRAGMRDPVIVIACGPDGVGGQMVKAHGGEPAVFAVEADALLHRLVDSESEWFANFFAALNRHRGATSPDVCLAVFSHGGVEVCRRSPGYDSTPPPRAALPS